MAAKWFGRCECKPGEDTFYYEANGWWANDDSIEIPSKDGKGGRGRGGGEESTNVAEGRVKTRVTPVRGEMQVGESE